jgi:hypothetical protein
MKTSSVAAALAALALGLCACSSTSSSARWNNTRSPEAARVVSSAPAANTDYVLQVDKVDGLASGFAAATRWQAQPALIRTDDALYVPSGAHALNLSLVWVKDSGNFRYTAMNSTSNAYHDKPWSDATTVRPTITASFLSGHTYRLTASAQRGYEVTLSDITAGTEHPVVVQTWSVAN